MGLKCTCFGHKMAVRHKVELLKRNWIKTDLRTGKEIPGSEWTRTTYLVVKECSRTGCKHQTAYKMYTDSNNRPENETHIEDIHPDLAEELLFVDKV